MRRVQTVVERSNGLLQLIPVRELWEVSAVLADTFPLDRSLATAPRWSRRTAHWIRLALVDRAITNRDRTALFTLSDTPWVPAAIAGVTAALVAPRIPAWGRRLLFGAGLVWVVRGRRARRFLEMRRNLASVAPGALLVGDFVAREPGAAMPWAAEVLDAIGMVTAFVALLPDSGDPRRDSARVRLYTRRLGFRFAGTAIAGGRGMSILVRDRGPRQRA
jgi:hypothetical protein